MARKKSRTTNKMPGRRQALPLIEAVRRRQALPLIEAVRRRRDRPYGPTQIRKTAGILRYLGVIICLFAVMRYSAPRDRFRGDAYTQIVDNLDGLRSETLIVAAVVLVSTSALLKSLASILEQMQNGDS